MPNLLLSTLCVLTAGAPLTEAEAGPRSEELLARAIEVRHARLAGIEGLSCSFRWEASAAPEYIASLSRETNVSIEKLTRDLRQVRHTRFHETSKGPLYLQSSTIDVDGHEVNKVFLSFDGSKSLELSIRLSEDGRESARATLDADLALPYATMAVARHLLDGILPQTEARPLVTRVLDTGGAVASGMETIDGHPCLKVRWEGDVFGVPTRDTIWLDPARQFVLRRGQVEVRNPGMDHFFTFWTWAVQDLRDKELLGRGGVEGAYVYPAEATLLMYSSAGVLRNKISIEDLQFNPAPDLASFTPAIPPGAEVRSARAAGWVGIGEQSPAPSRHGEGQGEGGAPRPGGARETYGLWTRLVGGGAALIVAFLLWRRGGPRRSP